MGVAGLAFSQITAFDPGLSLAKGVAGDQLATRTSLDLDELQGEVHDAWVTIDPAVFARNIETLRQDVGADVKLCIVMKSDAYGHGVENLIRHAQAAKPEYIAIVENRDLHKAVRCMEQDNTVIPILRIAPATLYEAGSAALLGWPVEELVGSLAQAQMLSRVARWASGKRRERYEIPIHINIDTGMGRMGFMHVDEAKEAMRLPGLSLRGVMTHFCCAGDMKLGEQRTREQSRKFDKALAQMKLNDNVIIHTANSEATLRFPWTRRDMVRVGGAFYGDIEPAVNPDGRFGNCMPEFATQVAWVIKDAPPNTPVGYDNLYHTPAGRTSSLASIKVGYNNGLPNHAFQQGVEVLIRGRRFPLVGKISMNVAAVDVSSQNPDDPVSLGDEALLWGRQGSAEILQEELAEKLGLTTTSLRILAGTANPRRLALGEQGHCFFACTPI